MTTDHIWDDTSGKLLATIKEDKVFRATDNRQIGTMQGGNLYDLEGKLLGHVQSLHSAQKGTAPAAFLELARGNDG